jgi:tRNA(Ile2) C34 agmatinyltransferase TiaS
VVGIDGRIPSYLKDKTPIKKRKCLKCGKHFESKGVGNRLCLRCSLRNLKYSSSL